MQYYLLWCSVYIHIAPVDVKQKQYAFILPVSWLDLTQWGVSISDEGITINKQEAQLMLTNTCDTFRGQWRSPDMVPFHMLGMVSYLCATVTSSLRCAVFQTFDFKKYCDLEIQVRGHLRSSELTQIHLWLPMNVPQQPILCWVGR